MPRGTPHRAAQVQQKVLNAEGKDVLRDVAFELNDLNDGKTEAPRARTAGAGSPGRVGSPKAPPRVGSPKGGRWKGDFSHAEFMGI